MKTLVSFSGGRTSAMMSKMLLDQRKEDDELMFVFANTGEEDERTLEFVNRCDKEWGLGVVWVEAEVTQKNRVATTHRIVTFETATRGPILFERMIEKYGIPNKNYPHCTRELKQRPIHSYAKLATNGQPYRTAIGIRADEIDRVNPAFEKLGLYYPLCDAKIRKADVFAFWDKQSFDLQVPEHRGNCVWCWKKSLRKHLTLARETPQIFKFAMRMEEKHAYSGAGVGPRRFFREKKTARELIELSREPFETFIDQRHLDQGGGCEESCEVHDGQEEMSALWEEAAE